MFKSRLDAVVANLERSEAFAAEHAAAAVAHEAAQKDVDRARNEAACAAPAISAAAAEYAEFTSTRMFSSSGDDGEEDDSDDDEAEDAEEDFESDSQDDVDADGGDMEVDMEVELPEDVDMSTAQCVIALAALSS